tara:strand:+ start:63 stop:902 length:840 start_codon:yes stop_codon:yes gene_type:complete
MKLLLENWRKFLEEEKQLDLFNTKTAQPATPSGKNSGFYEKFYITYDFGGPKSVHPSMTDKPGVKGCDGEIYGGSNEGVGVVYLNNYDDVPLMKFEIHKYSGWIGDLGKVYSCVDDSSDLCYYDEEFVDDEYFGDEEDCKDTECGKCIQDLKRDKFINNNWINKTIYSGHWTTHQDISKLASDTNVSRRQLAMLGIALRESALFLIKKEMGAKYYAFADATHNGRSNESAQKVVKMLIKKSALGKAIDMSPSGEVDPDDQNQYLIFPIAYPKNVFKVRG